MDAAHLPPEPARRTPGPLLPLVWLLAAGWVALQVTGRRMEAGLEAWDRAANAAWRAVVRGARAAVRALGPLGRALLRLLAPVSRLVRRTWAWLNVQVLLRMFRPLRRWAQVLIDRVRPAAEWLRAAALRLVERLQPVLQRLTGWIEHVEDAAARLSRALARAWLPVTRAARRLRGAGAS